ncbi:MerR family transcriptional regulator [Demequina globuliformis]|uniref:MerR family transcriptional regulator n=1 Tax=Demequina globuliformis TaxID=676202 RepID=UPI000784E6FD|nr:MerR family transcriptional regulator [Demequina globuliformis]
MPAPDPAATLHIGAVAERTELSLRTLRHYDEVGLVTPSGRSDGGFRLYTEADIERIMLVRRMKPLGFSLDEMGEVLALAEALGDTATADVQNKLADYLELARERRAKLERTLSMADEFIALLEQRRADAGA